MSLDADARKVQFHAGSSIPVLVTVAMIVTVAIDPLVNHLVPVALVDAPGPADVLAADFTAHAGNRFRDAKLCGRVAQIGRTARGPGIRLT
jgi:hypothetical protein